MIFCRYGLSVYASWTFTVIYGPCITNWLYDYPQLLIPYQLQSVKNNSIYKRDHYDLYFFNYLWYNVNYLSVDIKSCMKQRFIYLISNCQTTISFTKCIFLFIWSCLEISLTSLASPFREKISRHLSLSILLCKCTIIILSKSCRMEETWSSESSSCTARSNELISPSNSSFMRSSDKRFLIPALIISDLPENPSDLSLSKLSIMSSFNETLTMVN